MNLSPENGSACRRRIASSCVPCLLPVFALLLSGSPPDGRLLRAASPAAEDGSRFELNEMFGVSHPDQIVTFDLARPVEPQRAVLVGDDGSEVPYQLVADGKRLAVRTRLEAGQRKTFTLRRGTPTVKVAEAVTVRETADGFEIANGLTGVRVPKPVNTADSKQLPAPIQGVFLRDGRWYGTGPNWLGYQSEADWTKKTVATGMTVRFLERGPVETVVQIDYRFEHPDLMYGQTKLKPAGQGYYTSTITLQAGQPSILFEEDTDFEPKWSIELYDAVQPTHARYRGHHSSEAKFGYEPDGQRLPGAERARVGLRRRGGTEVRPPARAVVHHLG